MSQNSFEYVVSTHPIRAISLYYCGWAECHTGHFFGPAVRAHYLFHYVLSGKGYYTVGDTTYTLREGQGFLICPGVSTYYEADLKEPWSYCWFSFDGYEAKLILEHCGLSDQQLIFEDRSNGELAKSIFSLIEEFEQKNLNEYTILAKLYATFSQMRLPTELQPDQGEQSYTEKAAEFISNNFSYDIKIQDIAHFVGIDRTYLYKLFRQEYGCSPQQYLIDFRLHTACSLLRNTEMNITEIVYSCGFKDTPAFYKQFRKHFHVTPAQYRNAEKDKNTHKKTENHIRA